MKNTARGLRAHGHRRAGCGVEDTTMGQWRNNNGTLGGGTGASVRRAEVIACQISRGILARRWGRSRVTAAMMFAVARAPEGQERIPQMSQRLLAEKQNNPRGDYTGHKSFRAECVLSPSQCVLAQGDVSHAWWGHTSQTQPRPTPCYRCQQCFLGCQVIRNWLYWQMGKPVPFTFRP